MSRRVLVTGAGGYLGGRLAPRLVDAGHDVRGLADRLTGGVGLRRGRREAWRVEGMDRGRLLRPRAEMRGPGRAWLELVVTSSAAGTHCRQRAVFLPSGLTGRLHWWALVPAHHVIFEATARRMVGVARMEDRR